MSIEPASHFVTPPVASGELDAAVVGMHCAGCASAVEKALQRAAGVSVAEVNLATERARVEYDAGVTRPEALASAVQAAGYQLVLPAPSDRGSATGEGGGEATDAEAEARAAEVAREWRYLLVGLLFTVPLFALSMARDFALLGEWAYAPWVGWLFAALATPVQFYTGGPWYLSSWRAIRSGSLNMDVLVALGSTVAYVYSLAVLTVPGLGGHVYFETAAMIITLIRVGKLLEARARGRASDAIRKLMDLAPDDARRIDANGTEETVRARDLRAGDRIVVLPGERLPADGTIESGESAIDESLVTGEPVPVDKTAGDRVTGGTLNQHGRIVVTVTAVGEASVLGEIVRLVHRAQGSKPPIQALADRISAVFVPTIVALALLTLGIWWIATGDGTDAMIRMVAVLVIACPCALGLATPTAIVVGTGKAATAGILFRTGAAIEQAGRVGYVIFDKTGTVTEGKPSLTDWEPADGHGDDSLALIAGIESGSEHPVAQAVVTGAKERGIDVPAPDNANATVGSGIRGRIRGKSLRVGKPEWFPAEVIASVQAQIDQLAAQGKTVMVATIDDELAGVLAVSDRIRPTAAAAVEQLHEMGVHTTLLTGDREATAQAIARQAGITRVIAGVTPDRKAAEIESMRAELKRESHPAAIAMVGDGLNDAPALATADVGIAIGSGTDVAIEAADVTLMHADPADVARAIRISRQTMRAIRQNLFLAFIYNVLLIPIAAGVLAPIAATPAFLAHLHPIAAAGAMALSSICVVGNSLRLKRARI